MAIAAYCTFRLCPSAEDEEAVQCILGAGLKVDNVQQQPQPNFAVSQWRSRKAAT